jgi:dCMP deaminase
MDSIPSWQQYNMDMARQISTRSKDPKRKVGCYIVTPSNIMLAGGYNGFRPGFPETAELWSPEHKHDHVIHAEINALENAMEVGVRLEEAHIYSTHFPCMACAEELVAVGVSRLYYDVELWKYEPDLVHRYLAGSGVIVKHYEE